MTATAMDITAQLIRDLLREQHPDLADRPLKLGARGRDNQVWRLGDDLTVRLPWATQSADALQTPPPHPTGQAQDSGSMATCTRPTS